ncbi:membrane protease subunits, stomatin/prohibitin homologs [Candidatus Scalindua japonica]|uniref:Protein HflC n=1 Tax=Candidatus Scalindua japonica TaxID=1284222 RepID=A0A286TTR2_9BACT|nr:protease modulator HflC [Candidatus Scalindua japonica]GAX59268.1 membrane protease subunits, stomatin/prohibitin homologs [Candidatus Scalindua japonica]
MTQKSQAFITIAIITIVVIIIIVSSSFYVVDIKSQCVITQFGRPVKVVQKPGLNVKTPFIQKAKFFEKRIIEWDGEPSDILTRDKENIGINTWARWRIVDPLKFYTSLGTESRGQGVLDEVIESSVKNIVSSYPLNEILRNTNRKLEYTTVELEKAEMDKKVRVSHGRSSLVGEINKMANEGLRERYGMELVDVRIKHVNYVPAVIPKIFDRMRSERIRIASKYESEGRREEAEILGYMKKELEKIESEGYKIAVETRGEADAEAIRIYADAYKKAPEFYSFTKTLETYEKTIDENTRLYLSTDSEYYKYINDFIEK